MQVQRRLYVLRHAKSSWDDPGQYDHDRPLAPRGRRAVNVLAEYVAANDIRPELVLCSSSRRTRETLEGVHPGGVCLIEHELYDASHGQLIERLRRVPAATPSVMVIGHNPAMQMLVLKLASRRGAPADNGSAADLDEVERKFPTGALATLQFTCEWGELASGCVELTGYVRPKALSHS
jgi:phosphohistidine phosphatase